MRRVALIALAAGLAGFASLANAETSGPANSRSANQPQARAVIELFTSQGCSSCPAADAVLGRLADRDDLIAISLPVDYWDYLGWKDTLAKPKFSERQKAYAKMLGDGMAYTPQAVVNGAIHVNGSDEHKVEGAIDKMAKAFAASNVPVRLSEVAGKLVVEVGAAPQGVAAKEATVWLAVIAKSVDVTITRGENKGKTVTYSNVVRDLLPIGTWSGKAMSVQLERHSFMHDGAERCAVLVQQGRAGPIVGAALMAKF
jgi:hypothetical protein